MKVHSVIYSIDKTGGGPSRSVTQLCNSMGGKFHNSEFNLFTGQTEEPILNSFSLDNCRITLFPTDKLGKLINFEKNSFALSPELYHGHGIWNLPVHQMVKMALKSNKPYIISPRGMLDTWSLNQKKWKKKIALQFYQNKDLHGAACLHATSLMEAKNYRKLGFKNPIAIIPNGILLQNFQKKEFTNRSLNKKILFLSRIHRQKGIELLISAWGKLPHDIRAGWIVDIIGDGNCNYINTLKLKIKNADLENQIFIKPPIYGSEKLKVYQAADVFVLPSYSESYGIVVAEALATGTPVITTNATPWEELETRNCGWYIKVGEKPLMNALLEVISAKEKIIYEMGENGRKLIEEKYSMNAVSSSMYALYSWILGKQEKPDFVQME